LKKYIFVIALLAIVIAASGCTDTGNQTANQTTSNVPTKTYQNDQFSFEYPETWEIVNSTTPSVVVAVGDPKSADSNGNINTLTAIQSAPLPSGSTLKDTFDATYQNFEQTETTYNLISEGSITVNGLSGYENIHTIDVNGVTKKERAVWLEKNGTIYVILCGALPADFDTANADFNVIINSFKIK